MFSVKKLIYLVSGSSGKLDLLLSDKGEKGTD